MKILSGILLDFIISAILYFIARLLHVLSINIFSYSSDSNIPYTFSSIWIILILMIPYFILRNRGVEKIKLLGLLFIISLGGNLSSKLTRWIIHYVPKIDNIEIIKSNYIGVAGLDEVEYDNNFRVETTSIEYSRSYVYDGNDNSIEKEKYRLNDYHSQGVETERFIFWQTALSMGYNPKYISNFNCCGLLSQRLKLYFTAGPLLVTESFIEAIKDALLILFVLIIFRLVGKPVLFDNIETLKTYLKEGIYKE